MKVEVIKHKIGVDSYGREVSPFSSNCVGIKETGKWTFKRTENGRVTYGLGRKALTDYNEALAIAEKANALHN